MHMGRKRTTSSGLPPGLYQEGPRFRYISPKTGKRKWLDTLDRDEAIRLAQTANLAIEALRADRSLPEAITIGHGIAMYLENVVPRKPWDTGTKKNALWRLDAIKRAMGHRTIATTDRVYLADWLDGQATSGDVHNKWRAHLVDLWRYFIARRWCDFNEAEAVMVRSTSAKLEENRKKRQRMELDDFWAIHDHGSCPAFLRIAMEQSLITLQARTEICAMRTSHYRDGWLFVIRDKVAGDTDMAFIRIQITEQLEDIKRRAMADGILTDYLVHRRAQQDRPQYRGNRPHWAAVMPAYLSKAFRAVRDATGRWDGQPALSRPTFHEIRSLGAREYRKAGYPEEYIQGLMTHADPKTTQIYLAGGKLTDDHYHKVAAGMRLEDLKR